MEALPPTPKVLEIRDVAEEIDNAVSQLLVEPVSVVEDPVSELLTEPVLVVCEKVASAVEASVSTVEAEVVEVVKSSSCLPSFWASWWRKSRALPATSKVPSL